MSDIRKITLHQTDAINRQIDICALSRDQYVVEIPGTNEHGRNRWDLDFQSGFDPNGLTMKILLAIMIDRVEQIQQTRLASREYASILGSLKVTLEEMGAIP